MIQYYYIYLCANFNSKSYYRKISGFHLLGTTLEVAGKMAVSPHRKKGDLFRLIFG